MMILLTILKECQIIFEDGFRSDEIATIFHTFLNIFHLILNTIFVL